MALVLEANYSKKLGLPGYSSHQYSLTVRTEIADVSQVAAESKRLYALLQGSVDREIQSTGFIPAAANRKHTMAMGIPTAGLRTTAPPKRGTARPNSVS